MGKLARCSILIVFGLTACATPKSHPYELDEANVGAPGVEVVGLLPLNVLLALPPELDGSTRRVSAAIRSHLEECGVGVVTFGLGESRKLWNVALAGESDQGDASMQKYVETLRATRSFDALVVPNLVYREARIRAVTRKVEWDGVTRRLGVKGHPGPSDGFHWMGDFFGSMPGVSLHLAVYEDGSAPVFNSFGGIDLIHEADVSSVSGANSSWRWGLKRKPLGDPEALREGVRLAFTPYLEPPSPIPGPAQESQEN